MGSYVVRNYMFDITCMFIFGIVGYFLAKMRFPAAPFMLGLVLGTMADSNLRRALTLSGGSVAPFFTRPISLFFVIVVIGLILSQMGVFKLLFKKKKGSEE